ncbi:20199_t:CDS:2, partial [Gigaspora rosea]
LDTEAAAFLDFFVGACVLSDFFWKGGEVPELEAAAALPDFFGRARELPDSFEGELPSNFTGVGEFLEVGEILDDGELLDEGELPSEGELPEDTAGKLISGALPGLT